MNRLAMATSEVLDLAADYVETYGWRRATGWDVSKHATQGTCIEGALMAVTGAESFGDGLRRCPAYRAVQDFLGGRDGSLWLWNDYHAQDQHHVVQTLRGAAFAERRRAQQDFKIEVMV